MKESLELFLKNPYLYLFGLILIGSYFFFKRKFENLADKDDVADLTREVEKVKKEFNEDLENLKFNLDVIKADKIALTSDRRKAIYDLWSSMNEWKIIIDSFLHNRFDTFEEVERFKNEINKGQSGFNHKKSIFELMFNDEIDKEFYVLISNLELNFIELSRVVIEGAYDLFGTNLEGETKPFSEVLQFHSERKNSFIKKVTNNKSKLKARLVLLIKENSK